MRGRRRAPRWGPRIAAILLFGGCLAVAGWVVMRSSGNDDDAAPTTTKVGSTVRRTAPRPRRPTKKPPQARSLTLPDPLPSGTVVLPILMYHRIDSPDPSLPSVTQRLTVSPDDFEAEMQWLHDNGFHAVTQLQVYNALIRGRPLPSRPVLVTFDDGYRDVLRYAVPVLHRLHMPATAYVITSRVSNGDTTWFTWGELRRMERIGWDVGSHTVTHPDLTILSSGAATAQLVHSRNALEKQLGHPVQWLAYPSGAENSSVVDMARRAGYVLAVTTQPGTDQDRARPLELRRYEVLDSTGVAGVAAFVSG